MDKKGEHLLVLDGEKGGEACLPSDNNGKGGG